MLKYWLIPVLALTVIWALPIFVIRAQSYDDRAIRELVAADCPAPCLMGIRPGISTLIEGVYFLEAHDWVATRVEQMPSMVQSAVFYDAGVHRTDIQWRWNIDSPAWINTTQNGILTVEDREVEMLTIDTYITVGEVMLAFGDPDVSWFMDQRGSRFEYTAWYDTLHMLIIAEGLCPPRHVVHFPVRIRFYALTPRMENFESTACR